MNQHSDSASLPAGVRAGYGLNSVATGTVREIPVLRVVADPDSTLVAVATDGSCDVFTGRRRDEGRGLAGAAAVVVRRGSRRPCTCR